MLWGFLKGTKTRQDTVGRGLIPDNKLGIMQRTSQTVEKLLQSTKILQITKTSQGTTSVVP